MKKVFKFLPICAGLLTLASCNSDDLFGDKGNVDLSDKIVMEIIDGDAMATRSSLTSGGALNWDEDDVIRAYDSKLQKYDNFEFEPAAGKFVLNGDPLVDEVNGVLDYTYVLYGVDNDNISYAGWKNDGEKGYNLALLKIMDSYEYKETPATENGVVKYKNIVPRYGKVKEGSVNGESFETTVYLLTGLARVRFENGNGLGVEKVRARAVTFKDEASKASFDELELKQQAKASETYEKNSEELITEDDAPKLNGWFEAVLDEGLTGGNGQGLKPTDALVSNQDASNVIEVTVDEDAMEDFTSAIFFPIVSGEYDLILFEYCVDDEWYYIGKCQGEVKRGQTIDITPAIAAAFDIKDKSLIPGKDTEAGGKKYVGLQSYLEKYAGYNKSLTINVEGDIAVGSGTSKTEFIELSVPEIAEGKTLTLNIDGKITTEGSPLTISGNVGKGELVINYNNAEEAVKPEIVVTAGGTIALNSGENSAGYDEKVTVNKTGKMTLDGKFAKAVAIENVDALVLGGEFTEAVTAPEGMAGDIIVAGTYNAGATLETTGNITVNAVTVDNTGNAKMTLKAGKITIAGTVGTLETTGETTVIEGAKVNHTWTHNSGDLTVKGTATGGTVTVKGGVVTVAEGGKINNLTLASGATSATINGGTMNRLYTTGVPATLNDVTVSDMQIKAATGNAESAGVTINGGTVTKLTGYDGEDAAETTVKTVGTVDIKTVETGENLKFTSTIDDKTEPVAVTDAETVNIYTGAQLLALKGSSTLTSVKTINLNTDVTAENVEWTPSNILYNKANTFNGNEHEINGLKIVKNGSTTTNIAFFSRINNTANVTVKELKLSALTYDGEATANVAGLVGTVTSSVTIEAVDIAGEKLYGVETVNNVGGLIARASNGTITITKTIVTFEEIAGKQYVGGLIGDDYSADKSHTAKITVTGGENDIVTLTKLTSSSDATQANIATFGMLVGAVRSSNTALTITGEKLYSTNLIAGHRDDYLYDSRTYSQDGATFKFMGVDGNYVGFCSAYDYTSNSSKKNEDTKVTIGTKNYTWNELNKFDVNWVK